MSKTGTTYAIFNGPDEMLQKGTANVSRRRDPVHSPRTALAAIVEMLDESGSGIAFENHDLNPSGVFLYSDFLLCEGETMPLRLTLPFRPLPIYVEGEVVSASTGDSPGMGVVFRSLLPEHRTALQTHLLEKASRHA